MSALMTVCVLTNQNSMATFLWHQSGCINSEPLPDNVWYILLDGVLPFYSQLFDSDNFAARTQVQFRYHSTTCSLSSSSLWNWLCKARLHFLLLALTPLTMASWNSSRLGSKTATILLSWSKNWHVQWEMPLGGAQQPVCNMGSSHTVH